MLSGQRNCAPEGAAMNDCTLWNLPPLITYNHILNLALYDCKHLYLRQGTENREFRENYTKQNASQF
jgi:hypothetical protein